MGHAGAIISGGTGTAEGKLAVMEACGIRTTRNPSEIGSLLQSVLSSKKGNSFWKRLFWFGEIHWVASSADHSHRHSSRR